MPEDNSILNQFFKEVSNALSRVSEIFEQAYSNPVSIISFLRGRGWDVSFDTTITSNATELGEAIQDLRDLLDGSPEFSNILDAVSKMNAARSGIVGTLGLNIEEDFLQTLAFSLPRQLLDYALTTYLEEEHPKVAAVLALLGVLVIKGEEPTDPYRIPYLKREIRWEFFIQVLQTPERFHEHAYGWGSTEYDGAYLIDTIELALYAFGLSVGRFEHDEAANSLDDVQGESLLAEVFTIPSLTVGIELYEVGETDSPNAGLALAPYIDATGESDVQIGDALTVRLRGALELRRSFGVQLRQESGLELFGLETLPTPDGRISAALVFAPDEPLFRVGSEDRNMFALSGLTVGLKAELLEEEIDLEIEAGLQGLRLVLSTKGSDGFLSKILSDITVDSEIDITLGVGLKRGLFVQSSGSFDVTVPIHKRLGPIAFDSVCVSLGLEDGKIPLRIGVTLSAELGPISATVERLGLRAELKPDGGNIGPVGIDFGFLPPTGVGFAMDASVLVGGGFIDFDDVNQRYSGALALQLGEIGVTAIGLIATRMPDGSEGYSMLVNIGVTFEPAIQIYAGFSLAGVGGLVGVNRTMETEVLREGLKKGTLDSILFPDPASVIANANKIISDMRSVFPPEEGRFVVGPMLKIGWGTPTILTGEIGVFVETPEPVRVALMGQVEMALPDEEFEIVGIHIDILGTLDTERKELSFQASIQGTGMGAFELYGDCAFFLRWGDNPEMALAIGGFHPKFAPPPPRSIFSDLQQLRLNLTYGPLVQLRFGGYLALTPNSLQFGARIELFVGVVAVDAGISGFLSFDALFNFSPFSFEVGMTGGMAINVMGVNLANIRVGCTLSGPNPWNIRGTATVNVLFCDIDCGFNITWGLPSAELTAPIAIWPMLHKALERTESWGGQLPAGASLVESLRTIDEEPQDEDVPAPVIVHPAGTLEVRQNVVPLEITLDKFGNAPPQDYDRFKIKGAKTLDEGNTVDEFFSRGRFEDLSNQQKLSLPSFEKLPGGLTTRSSNRLSVTGVCAGQAVSYESITIKPDRTTQKAPNPEKAVSSWSQTRFIAKGNAAGRGALRKKGRARFAACGKPMVGAQEEKYVVVDVETLTPFSLDSRVDVHAHGISVQAEQAMAQQFALYPRVVDVGTLTSFSLDSRVDVPANGMTRVQAEQAMEHYLALYPRLVGNLTVVAEYEAREAA